MRRLAAIGAAALFMVVTAHAESGGALSKNDHTEIHELYARYAQAVDGSDKDAYGGVFTEDGVFIIEDPTGALGSPGRQTFTGRNAIAALVRGPRREHPKVTHFYSNILVDPAPGGAKGSVYVILIDLQKNPAIGAGGYCDDMLVRTKEGWRFKKRVCFVEPTPRTAAAAPSSTSGSR